MMEPISTITGWMARKLAKKRLEILLKWARRAAWEETMHRLLYGDPPIISRKQARLRRKGVESGTQCNVYPTIIMNDEAAADFYWEWCDLQRYDGRKTRRCTK